MNEHVLTPVPLADLLEQFREIVKEEIRAKLGEEEKLLSPAAACKVFEPAISRQTLHSWTDQGLIPMQKIGSRLFYKQSDIITAGATLKKYKHNL
jgi:hypothetical protein